MTNDDDATAAAQLLEMPVHASDAEGMVTVRRWLAGLLHATWTGRHLLGLAGRYWDGGLYAPMCAAGMVAGSYGVDGYGHDADLDRADELILAAIDAMGQAPAAAFEVTRGEVDLNAGRPVTWSSAVAPGGTVCAVPDPDCPDGICGNPVESEPCDRHDSELPGYLGMLEAAWGLIANAGWNAGTGDVDQAKSPGWHEAAVRWRDGYHALLGSLPRAGLTPLEALAAELETEARTPSDSPRAAYRALMLGDFAALLRDQLTPKWDALTAELDAARAEVNRIGDLLTTTSLAKCDAMDDRDAARAELASLQADYQDLLATQDRQWARCPDGCGCRLATEDADARECGCDGPCTTECRENGYPDKPSYRDQAVKHALDERDALRRQLDARNRQVAELQTPEVAGIIADRANARAVITEMLDWYWQPGGVNDERVARWRKRAGMDGPQ
jgi:HPt (histidine-containing phosphotransfer) domain-containing protein